MARIARTEVFDPRDVAVVHVLNRVVRRCFLMGDDPDSGKNLDHRKIWVECELKRLAASMGIDLLRFAVLSKHCSRLDVIATWSVEEAASPWCKLCPMRKCADGTASEPVDLEIAMIVNCPARLQKIRQRLSDIWWWMRILCQAIAIQRMDGEIGKFWQSRYRAVRLIDEEAVLACAIYVDRNPIRAAMVQTLETSDFTSVQRRIASLSIEQADEPELTQPGFSQASDSGDSRLVSVGIVNQTRHVELPSFLSPVEIDEQNDEAGPCASVTGQRCSDKGFVPMSLASYLELLDWTARHFVSGKSGVA